jgi:hypothetical protein
MEAVRSSETSVCSNETTQRCIRLITLIDDGGSTVLWNVGLLRDYTALYKADHPEWWWRQYGPLKRRSTPTRLHSAVSGWSPWLMMEAVRFSETSVYSNETTRRCIRLITLIDDGGSTVLWNVGLLQRDYTALYQTDHPDWWWRQYGPQKRRSTQTRLHSAVSGWSPWLMMEAVRSSETSVYSNETTRRCIRLITLIDDGGSTALWNVGLLKRDYTALYPRRL